MRVFRERFGKRSGSVGGMEERDPVARPEAAEPGDHAHTSLRGTFILVLLMAAFFVAAWLGMLALAMERR